MTKLKPQTMIVSAFMCRYLSVDIIEMPSLSTFSHFKLLIGL